MKNIKSLFIAASLLAITSISQASPWAYPDEISVAEAYNAVYDTSYVTDDDSGLSTLISDHGSAMQSNWTLDEISSLTILTFDTSSTAHFGISVNNTFIDLFNPGAWTPPSRDWINDPSDTANWNSGIFNLADIFAAEGIDLASSFSLVVGNSIFNSHNTVRIDGLTSGEFFLGYNGGGLNAGDGDANEPLIYVNPTLTAVPVPAAAWLFASGLIGLTGIARRKKA